MRYTIKELGAITKEGTYGYSELDGVSLRVGKKRSTWYWRGVFKREPILMSLGRSPKMPQGQIKTVSQWLDVEDRRIRGLIDQGIDPRKKATPRNPDVPTLDALWKTFLTTKTTIKQGYKDDIDGKWIRSCKPLHTLQPHEVTTKVVSDLFDGFLVKGIISTAHHIYRILRPFFHWVRRKYSVLPVDLLDFELPDEDPEQLRLSAEEIPAFGKMLLHGHGKYDYSLKWNVVFLLLTGCRASFLVQWKPEWIVETPEGVYFDIPEGIEDLKDADFVLLPPRVKALLPLLKPCTKHTLRGAVVRVAKQAQVTKVSSHDLRRTFISVGCEEPLNFPEELMLAVTDHKSKNQLGRIYNKRKCLKMMPTAIKVSDHIANLLGLADHIMKPVDLTELIPGTTSENPSDIGTPATTATEQTIPNKAETADRPIRSTGLQSAVKVTEETIRDPFWKSS